ncbi:MAG: CocE/NonD family hydrolase [Pseudomonadales bacterium]|nr:CocE/NonD family hydrolase [Pseudomonadales bacterium]
MQRLLLTVLLSTALMASAQEQVDTPYTEEFANMRDQIKLAANVYLPDGEGPWPVIVTRTPYLKDNDRWHLGAEKYTDAGYAYVVQDTRGKGHSQGFYIAFGNDIHDGYDTVEWLAERPWSNGRIGITGGSAMGITANMAAVANPPHLEAAYVVVAPHNRFEYSFIGGAFKEADSGNWLRRQGVSEEVINALKARATWDVFWELTNIESLRDHIDIPMYNVGGWYDIFSIGAVNNFHWLQNHGAEGARGNQKLFMGPFGHGELSGDLEYPNAGERFTSDDEIRWFDYWLKDKDNGIMDEPPVKFYMMASARKGELSDKNRFIRMADWPPASEEVRYYLNDDFTLRKEAVEVGRYSYQFDPEIPVPTMGGANLTIERGPMDQRAIGERQDYLRFETAPLEKDVVIAGNVFAELWVATDGLDTDFMVKLVDVYPDGYEALVLDAPLRTRYRNGRKPDEVEMMQPDVPAKLIIDLWSTAITFEKGHKIALHVTSSNSPRFDVNPNTGAPPGSAGEESRVANNVVFFGGERPSALVLPVVYFDFDAP